MLGSVEDELLLVTFSPLFPPLSPLLLSLPSPSHLPRSPSSPPSPPPPLPSFPSPSSSSPQIARVVKSGTQGGLGICMESIAELNEEGVPQVRKLSKDRWLFWYIQLITCEGSCQGPLMHPYSKANCVPIASCHANYATRLSACKVLLYVSVHSQISICPCICVKFYNMYAPPPPPPPPSCPFQEGSTRHIITQVKEGPVMAQGVLRGGDEILQVGGGILDRWGEGGRISAWGVQCLVPESLYNNLKQSCPGITSFTRLCHDIRESPFHSR